MSSEPAADLPARDVQARVARLFVYPVKSCAGVEQGEVLLTETGLEFDRAWMVVDADGVFVTQRELPRMALIRPQLKYSEMVLRAPGMLALHIALDRVEEPCEVTVWKDRVKAYDMGDVAAQWFSDFLNAERPAGRPAQRLRLVRFDPDFRRVSSREWTGDIEALNQFSDGYPVLVTSEASIQHLNEKLAAAGHMAVGVERFRPNVVLGGVEAHDEDRLDVLDIITSEGPAQLKPVKPCARCPIPNINPETAESTPEVNDTLQTYRPDPKLNGAITFGMNCIPVAGLEYVLRVGQPVTADYVFE